MATAARVRRLRERVPSQNPPRGNGQRLRTGISAAVIVIWCLAPFYWMVVTAFRDVGFTFDTSPWPTHVTLDNFKTAFCTDLGNHFGQALLNSVFIGAIVTVIALIVGVFAAYALARLTFRFKGLVLGVILGASMFPGVALVTPLFPLFTDLGWMRRLPGPDPAEHLVRAPVDDLRVDGVLRGDAVGPGGGGSDRRLHEGQAFRKVILPLAVPGIFTTAILAFIASWNEFLLASQFSTTKSQPVTVAIAFPAARRTRSRTPPSWRPAPSSPSLW